ncbi:hypothetical protein ABPG75_011397 [Micractinium tetrahymenae]
MKNAMLLSSAFKAFNISWRLYLQLGGKNVYFGTVVDTPSESYPADSAWKVSWAHMRRGDTELVHEYDCSFAGYSMADRFCMPAAKKLPLYAMLQGAMTGAPFVEQGELLISVVLTPRTLSGSAVEALITPANLSHASSPLIRWWAYDNLADDTWGSEGFHTRRLPALPGDDCTTLRRASMCLSHPAVSLEADDEEGCSGHDQQCSARPLHASTGGLSWSEGGLYLYDRLYDIVAKVHYAVTEGEAADDASWAQMLLGLALAVAILIGLVYLRYLTLRTLLRCIGGGSARTGVQRLVWPELWLAQELPALLRQRSRAASMRRQLEKVAAKQQLQQQQRQRGGGSRSAAGSLQQQPRQQTATKQGGKQQGGKKGRTFQQKGSAVQRRAKGGSAAAQLATASSSAAGDASLQPAAPRLEAQVAAEVRTAASDTVLLAASRKGGCTADEAGQGSAPAGPQQGQAGPSPSVDSSCSDSSGYSSCSDGEAEPASASAGAAGQAAAQEAASTSAAQASSNQGAGVQRSAAELLGLAGKQQLAPHELAALQMLREEEEAAEAAERKALRKQRQRERQQQRREEEQRAVAEEERRQHEAAAAAAADAAARARAEQRLVAQQAAAEAKAAEALALAEALRQQQQQQSQPKKQERRRRQEPSAASVHEPAAEPAVLMAPQAEAASTSISQPSVPAGDSWQQIPATPAAQSADAELTCCCSTCCRPARQQPAAALWRDQRRCRHRHRCRCLSPCPPWGLKLQPRQRPAASCCQRKSAWCAWMRPGSASSPPAATASPAWPAPRSCWHRGAPAGRCRVRCAASQLKASSAVCSAAEGTAWRACLLPLVWMQQVKLLKA